MSVNQNNSFLSSPTFSLPPSPFNERSFSPPELSDDPIFEEADFLANSSNGGYASFWNSTPPRINEPLRDWPTPEWPDLLDMDPLTPVIPDTPPGGWPPSPGPFELLLDDEEEDNLFPPLTPDLNFINEAVFPATPEFVYY
ncbi:MAG: hypothetical protein JSR39_06300 [Verrucomicrobia bacterium]|nr:hypothetical protein [Verrucomicrobiota bacterium]